MTKSFLAYSLLCALLFAHGEAATSTWTGNVSTVFSDAANWDTMAPGSTDSVILSGNVPAYQPNIGSSYTIRTLDITSGGWTISSNNGTGGLGDFYFNPLEDGSGNDEVNISGSGLTIINANLINNQQFRAAELSAAANCTLVVSGNLKNSASRNWNIRPGHGTLILNGEFDSNAGLPTGVGNSGNYILNCPQTSVPVGASSVLGFATIGSGHFFGGTVPEIKVKQYSQFDFASGSKLSPGGIGGTVASQGYEGGNLISTMLFRSTSSARAGVNMNAGATIEMDIGTSLGSNDKIVIGNLTDDFDLNGCTLDLRTTGYYVPGNYLLMEETIAGSDVNGTFGTILLNGNPPPMGKIQLIYNSDNVIVSMGPLRTCGAMFLIQ